MRNVRNKRPRVTDSVVQTSPPPPRVFEMALRKKRDLDLLEIARPKMACSAEK